MGYLDYLYDSKKNVFFKINIKIFNKIIKKNTSTNIVFYNHKSNLIRNINFTKKIKIN